MRKITVVTEFKWPENSTYPCRNKRSQRFDIEPQKGLNVDSMKPGDHKIISIENDEKEVTFGVLKKHYSSLRDYEQCVFDG